MELTFEVATLAFLFAFYGIFVGFVAGGTFEPCTIAGAFDVELDKCQSVLTTLQKKEPNLVHTFTLTTRLEGFLWMSMGITSGLAILYAPLRPGALLAMALGCLLAAGTHMQHEGMLGEAPWHAMTHPFNSTLIGLDLLAAAMAIYCLYSSKVFKSKSA